MSRALPLALALLLLAGCGGTPQSAASSAVSPPPAASAPAIPAPAPGPLAGLTVCLDPGHGVTDARAQEPVSPLSAETKPAYVSGAEGRRITEEALNLQVALRLRDKLEGLDAAVRLTRETSAATVSNIERAQIANAADCCIRIHADGVDDAAVHGVSVLIPAGELLGTPSIAEPSRALGQLLVDAVAAQTGAKNRGLTERRDLTGFNWSEVPCVLLEMGFLSSPDEEDRLITPEYQEKIAEGAAQALLQWRAASS